MAHLKHIVPLPTVVLVGRTNVGKSTLFNRLARGKRALVSPIPGTTRDYQEATITWRGVSFIIVDTGGVDIVSKSSKPPYSLLNKEGAQGDVSLTNSNAEITAKVVSQARLALSRASLIVFITNVRDGVLPGDQRVAEDLRKQKALVILAVNKSESLRHRTGVAEFWKLGLGEPITISALTGMGTGNLLDRIVECLRNVGALDSNAPTPPTQIEPLHIAIIGRPNVGKSTLLNAIVGYERVIVSPHAHTTREPIDTYVEWEEEPILLVDTAGIRKKAKISRGLEAAGVKRSLEVLARADIAILVLDLTEGINDQDKTLARLAEEQGVGLVLVGNKWDLVRSDKSRPVTTMMANDLGSRWRRYLYGAFPFLSWSPIVFTSALHRDNVQTLLREAVHVGKARAQTLLEEEAQAFIQQALTRRSLPTLGPNKIRASFVSFAQTGTRPPVFEFAVRTKEKFPEQYARYLENALRQHFDFTGTPILINVKTIR